MHRHPFALGRGRRHRGRAFSSAISGHSGALRRSEPGTYNHVSGGVCTAIRSPLAEDGGIGGGHFHPLSPVIPGRSAGANPEPIITSLAAYAPPSVRPWQRTAASGAGIFIRYLRSFRGAPQERTRNL